MLKILTMMVNIMKKTSRIIIWILVAIVFLILILGISIWYLISNTNYVFAGTLKTKNISYELQDIENLEIDTGNLDIYIRESGNNMINLSLRTHNTKDFDIKKNNTILSIVGINKTLDSNFVKWINNNLKNLRRGKEFTIINPKLIIEIPVNSQKLNINFKENIGDILITHINVKKILGRLGSGNINLNNIITDSLELNNMQGQIMCDEIYSENIRFNLAEGNLMANEMYSKNINININKGNLTFVNENKNYNISTSNIIVREGKKTINVG